MRAPTREQERALAAAAAGGQTAVAAGAGAGKTTLMVEAVWRDLEGAGVDLASVVVVAYNRAAAAHLAARLQERFSEGRGPERAALDLSEAWVGTFHSLAARIVREHPFAAGVDPEFGELDETEAASLMEQALDEAMEACMGHEGFLDLVSSVPGLRGLRDATAHVHERLRAAGQERPRIQVPDAPGPSPGQVAALERAIARVDAHGRARHDHRERLALAREMIATGQAGVEAPRLMLNCARDLKPLCEEVNERAAEVFQALVDAEARAQLEGFARHLEEFAARYAALKRERGALDYEDLLLAARRVLRAGAGPRPARVYVDEFQDANALQDEIVDLLGAERTVVVGDGCQAIYGFRHADASHFAARVGDPPRVRLTDNHRSEPALLRSLNGLLERALADEPAFAPLTPASPGRPGPPLAEPPVEVLDVTGDDRPGRAEEAEVVADLVAGLRAHGYAPRDIAVLFRALTAVEGYRAALAARGIPVHLVAGRGFLTHEQVADTLALLALVENPHDERALVRVLASPYAAAGDADLVALRAEAEPAGARRWPRGGSLWAAARDLPAARPVVETVGALRPLLRERGLAGLVEAAVAARGYDLAVLGMADGARRHANLRRLVRMAAEHAAVRGPDLRGFLGLMDRMAEAGNQDPGEATLVDPDLDAVRLSTVHGVKGQEFPAVVLADASHGLPATPPMVVVDREGRAGIRINRVGGGATPALGHRELATAARAADAAEERRVLYVALTRAERHVAVVGRSTARGNVSDSAFQVLDAALGATPADGVARFPGGGAARRAAVPAPPAPGDGTRPRAEPPPVHPVAPPPAPAAVDADPLGGRRLSFSALGALAVCARRFHLEHELGLRGRPEAVVAGPGGAPASVWGGTALGDLVHRALAAHDWHGPAPAPGWAAAAAAAAGLPPSPADAARAEAMVAALLASPLASRLRAARALHPERAFALALGGTVLTGAIDLLADEGGGRALVVDWKTHALGDARSAAEVAAGYGLQQALYGLAALRAGHGEVTLVWAVLEDLGGSPVRTVRPADAPALEAEVAAAMEALRLPARPPVTRTPLPLCSGCPGLDAMCPVAAAAV